MQTDNLHSIQFLRFLAAALVLSFHSVKSLNEHVTGSVSPGLSYLAATGASGVHIFFVISGFIMIYTSFGRTTNDFSPQHFLGRRFVRIYPIYWIYAALYIVFYKLSRDADLVSASTAFGALALFPGYSSLIIGPGWTLSFEVYFYLCFAAIMTAGMSRGIVLLTVFFLASVASHGMIRSGDPLLHVVTNSLLLEFLAGAWIAFTMLAGMKIGLRVATSMVGLALLFFLVGIVVGYGRLPTVVTWGLPSALIGCRLL